MYQNLIAGDWLDGISAVANHNPSDASDIIGEYAQAGAEQTADAIAAAQKAFAAWSGSSIQTRADVLDGIGNQLLARKDELGDLLAREQGSYAAEFYTVVKTAYTLPQ